MNRKSFRNDSLRLNEPTSVQNHTLNHTSQKYPKIIVVSKYLYINTYYTCMNESAINNNFYKKN